MEQVLPLVFPHATFSVLAGIGLVCIGAFVCAIVVEIVRGRRDRRRQLQAEWEAVEGLFHERAFSPDEQELLRGLIRRRAARTPLSAVTTRRGFDECVDAEMAALQTQGDENRYRETGHALREIRNRLELDYYPLGAPVASTRALHSSQVLWVAKPGEVKSQWFRAVVTSLDEAYFNVAPRGEAQETPPAFRAGDELRCHLWRDDDARYEFRATLANVEGLPPSWTFFHTRDLRRVQTRAYYRVRYNQEITLALLASFSGTDAGPLDRRVVTRLRGRISSLSAGGLAVVTQQTVPLQSRVRLSLEIPGERPFEVEASVVGAEPLAGSRHLVRVMYEGIREEQRDVIARYVLLRQRPRSVSAEQPVVSQPVSGQE